MQINIKIDKTLKQPIYKQIIEQIKTLIRTNQLIPGSLLPPERKLAEMLGVNRTTVLNAYRELKADGILTSQVGKGTIVTDELYNKGQKKYYVQAPPWPHLLSDYARKLDNNTVRELLETANKTDIISFAAGVPSPHLDAMEAIRGIEQSVFDQPQHQALKMSPTEGFMYLRESISQYVYETRGIICEPDHVLVLAGAQQGIDIAARLFINSGDTVVVEKPSYLSALQVFSACGARVIGVPMEEDGMDMEKLEYILKRYRPKFIYTMPTFQNPTGIVMSLEKRKKILKLAYEHKIPIIEDDPYGQMQYEGEAIPTLYQLDDQEYVLHLNSFSKIFFPGLRIGYLIASEAVINQFAQVKQLTDLHANSISQYIVHRFLESKQYKQHFEALINIYHKKLNLMCHCLSTNQLSGLTFNRPIGGFYIWCKLPPNINYRRFYHELADRGVTYVPGHVFFYDGSGAEYARLNFTYPSEAEIKKGIAVFKRTINTYQINDKSNETVKNILPMI